MASVQFTDVQARPTEFLDFTSVTLDEFQPLVPPFEEAFHARMKRNKNVFPVWRAIEDTLILSLQETPQRYQAGEELARLVAYWCPGQAHQETAQQQLILHASPPETVLVEVDGYLCAGNFGETTVVLPKEMRLSAGQPLPLSWGVTGVPTTELRIALQLGAHEPMLLALPHDNLAISWP